MTPGRSIWAGFPATTPRVCHPAASAVHSRFQCLVHSPLAKGSLWTSYCALILHNAKAKTKPPSSGRRASSGREPPGPALPGRSLDLRPGPGRAPAGPGAHSPPAPAAAVEAGRLAAASLSAPQRASRAKRASRAPRLLAARNRSAAELSPGGSTQRGRQPPKRQQRRGMERS